MATDNESKLVAAAIRRLEQMNRAEDFDPHVAGSRPTENQLEIIQDFGRVKTQWIVAANRSGKSQTCARLIAWAVTDTHPFWKVPEDWKQEGMLILIAGKNTKQIEESLWHKIRSYLPEGSYKEQKVGLILQKVEINIPNSDVKHRILFQSMENVTVARERIQSYDAHIAWADEMINSAAAINEIRLRVTTKSGMFLCSFTPLIPSPAVKKLIDGASLPHARRYMLKTLDNPVFRSPEKKEELLSTFVGATESEIATRLNGEWAVGESQVYQFDYDQMVEMPPNYSTLWRHVESVDPALKSALGLTVWAEEPDTNTWYCVMAEYIKGILIPMDLVAKVREMTRSFNIVRRISDPHEVWYIQTASSMGISYMGVHKKNERKHELIKNLQQLLGSRRIRLSPSCQYLVSEFQECRWSDRAEGRIVNASSFHLLDSAQYFCDSIPPAGKKPPQLTIDNWHAELLKANAKRLEMEEKRAARQHTPIRIKRRGSIWK